MTTIATVLNPYHISGHTQGRCKIQNQQSYISSFPLLQQGVRNQEVILQTHLVMTTRSQASEANLNFGFSPTILSCPLKNKQDTGLASLCE